MRRRFLGSPFITLLACVYGSACTASDDDPNTDGMQAVTGTGGVAGLAAAGSGGGASGLGGGGGGGGAAGSMTPAAGNGGRGANTGGASGAAGASAGAGAGGSGAGSGGAGGAMQSGGRGGSNGGTGGDAMPPTERFSFFVTSLEAMRELSGSDQGFGGDLRFGEATGLAGADKICATIADMSMPGASAKQWRAFLSASAGGQGGGPVHAKDRIGGGPWYDRMGRLVAMDLDALLNTRPVGADPLIAADLPNEHGEPNHQGVDNHDTVTGSNEAGEYDETETCEDWTNAPPLEPGEGGGGRPGPGEHNGPMAGHSWPAQSGQSWIAAHRTGGCAAGVNLVQNGAGSGNGIGAGGGYGGIYCLALLP